MQKQVNFFEQHVEWFALGLEHRDLRAPLVAARVRLDAALAELEAAVVLAAGVGELLLEHVGEPARGEEPWQNLEPIGFTSSPAGVMAPCISGSQTICFGVSKSGSPMPRLMTSSIMAAMSKKRRMPEGGT